MKTSKKKQFLNPVFCEIEDNHWEGKTWKESFPVERIKLCHSRSLGVFMYTFQMSGMTGALVPRQDVAGEDSKAIIQCLSL